MLLLFAQILFVGLTILGLYALRRRLGLTLIFVFVASSQFVQNLLATTVYVELLGRYPVSPGSAVLFSASLLAVLLVYLREDIATTQRLIYGILLANLTLAAVAVSTRWGVARGYLTEIDPVSDWLVHYELGGFALGTGLLIADVFILIILYEVLRSRMRWTGEWLRIVASLSLVLLLDTVVFVGLMFRGDPGAVSVLIGNLIGKGSAGVLYGSLLWGFLKLRWEDTADGASREIRDPLSILTFRERYEALQDEVEHLDRLRERERQRAEVALRGARLGAWTWNLQTGETFFDDLWAEMLGFRREDVQASLESWKDLIHPDDRKQALAVLDAHLEGETSFYEVEHRLRTRVGAWKWILSMGRVVEWDPHGRPVLMTGTHMDVDERKVAEERAAHFGAVLDRSLNEIFTFDAESLRFADVNRGARENLGYTIEELRRLTPLDIKPEYTPESFATLIEPLRRGSEQTVQFTTVHLRKDGTRYPVEVHLQCVHFGKPVFVAIVLDITERLRGEAELERVERRYRELFEGAPLKYVITENRDGVPYVADCNSTFLKVLGYDREEVLGRPLSDFYSPDSSRKLLREGGGYEQVIRGGRIRMERQLVTKTGRIVETILSALPERDSAGRVIGTRAMYVDITERKRAEEELERTSTRLRKLAARLEAVREEERKTVARDIHDELGQRLTGIKMDLSWIGQRVDDRVDGLRERVAEASELIDQTVDSVRQLSSRLRPALLDDLGLREAVLWESQEFSRRSGVECLVDFPEALVENIDREPDRAVMIFRVLQEALTNVFRHAEASRVTITLASADDQVLLSVEDNGKGFDPEVPRSEDALGLLGMKERAESFGGSLDVHSAESRGCSILLKVPL